MKTIIFTLLLLASGNVWSQYRSLLLSTAYGVNSNSASASYRYNAQSIAEGIFSITHDGNRKAITMLYEEQYRLFKVEGLHFYAGIGLHAAVMSTHEVIHVTSLTGSKGEDGAAPADNTITHHKWIGGADAIAGLRYQFTKTPVLVFVSFKPYIDYVNEKGSMVEGSVGIAVAIHD